jgi:hypothetical protein
MICEACRERRHGECRGGTWCDCQHEPPAGTLPTEAGSGTEPAGTGDGDEGGGGDDREDGPEPGVNWLRQG